MALHKSGLLLVVPCAEYICTTGESLTTNHSPSDKSWDIDVPEDTFTKYQYFLVECKVEDLIKYVLIPNIFTAQPTYSNGYYYGRTSELCWYLSQFERAYVPAKSIADFKYKNKFYMRSRGPAAHPVRIFGIKNINDIIGV